jgi:hypothetical protein
LLSSNLTFSGAILIFFFDLHMKFQGLATPN